MAKYKWDKERIENAVKESFSYRETLRKLGVNLSGNNGETLKKKIIEYNIDVSHFTFHAATQPKLKKDINCYLVKDSHISSFKLKEKLVKCGLKENKCECCGIDEWFGKPLSCQLHHINGDNTDNRLENLQILCPNCHSQTENYCGQANKKEHKKNYCKDCGRELKTKNAKYCLSCASKRRAKKEITKEELILKLKKHNGNRSQLANEMNVSETTIRKWCKKFGLPVKSIDLKKLLLQH